MKRFSKILIASSMAFSFFHFSPFVVDAATSPSDLYKVDPSAQSALSYLYQTNKIGGYSDGTFRPNNSVTRAEFASMIVRALELKSTGKVYSFSDSNSKNWHYYPLSIAYEYKIIGGKGYDKWNRPLLKPDDKITRAEMMVMLVRTKELFDDSDHLTVSQADYLLNSYSDGKSVPTWARVGVAKALYTNISGGVSESKIGYNQNGTRIQSALFSYRTLMKMKNENVSTIYSPYKTIVDNRETKTIILDDGSKYIGTLNSTGDYDGKGKLYYGNGNLQYSGAFKNGYFDGNGYFYDDDGSLIYRGSFKDGYIEGFGYYYDKNGGYLYIGTSKKDKWSGIGTLYYSNGKVWHLGYFENDDIKK